MNNKSNISSKLKNKSLIVSQGYINGSFTSGTSNKTFNVNDPSTGELIVELPDMGVSETKEAINAAHEAQKTWAAKTGKERSLICLLYTSPSPRDLMRSRMPSSA